MEYNTCHTNCFRGSGGNVTGRKKKRKWVRFRLPTFELLHPNASVVKVKFQSCLQTLINQMFRSDTKNDRNRYYHAKDEDSHKEQPTGKSPTPITPKMLIKALKHLRKKSFKGLFFTPKEVAFEILKRYPNVEQDFQILILEVADKLICATAAGLIGTKQDAGYYAFDFRQTGFRWDTRSELMFWVFYKKILNRKLDEERKRQWAEKKEHDHSGTR